MMWTIPARIGGTWVAGERLTMVLDQKYQTLAGSVTWQGHVFERVTGVIDGDKVRICFAKHADERCRLGARGQMQKRVLELQIDDSGNGQVNVVAHRSTGDDSTTSRQASKRTR